MTVKQLSVFIENREGRLGEVLHVLKKSEVNILSMSLADTTEYGLLRLIVNDPEKGREALTADGFSSMVTDVFVIKIPHKAGSLQEILATISENRVNIEYMYGLSIDDTDATVVMKTSDLAYAKDVIVKNNIAVMTEEEIHSKQ